MSEVTVAVLDASVALKWALPEPGREQALGILDAYESGSLDLLAPRVFLEEVASALAKRCRRKELTPRQAQEAFRHLEQRKPLLMDRADHLEDALSLSIRHQLSLWDSLYLALAIARRSTLFTADQRLFRNAARHYPFVELIA
jgi:predicted nucleic acid-binding protein